MQIINYVYALIGILLGLTLGFCASNKVYRTELSELNLVNVNTDLANSEKHFNNKQSNFNVQSIQSLSDEELNEAIRLAQSRPDDLELQATLGVALYKYAVLEQKTEFFLEVARLLERVIEKNVYKTDALMAFGNALFILARKENDANKLIAARKAFAKAVQANPENSDLYIDLGLTYYFARPVQPRLAIEAYQKALKLNEKNERALENLIIAYISIGEIKKAENNFSILESLNPKHLALNNLRIGIAQAVVKKQVDNLL